MDIVTLAAARKGGSGGVSKDYVDTHLALKVDKIEGKGLSTNDYTNAEKTKVANSPISSSASGTSFALTDAADAPIAGLTVYGESHVSKNVMPLTVTNIKAVNTSGIWNENTYIISNGTIEVLTKGNNVIGLKINGTFSTEQVVYLYDTSLLTLTGSYTFGLSNSAFSDGGLRFRFNDGSFFSVIAQDVTRILNGTQIASALVIPANVQYNNVVVYPMICAAEAYEADPSFEPYGIISVGDNGLSVTSCGKNLFDGIFENGYLSSDDGNVTPTPTRITSKNYIPVNENIYISYPSDVYAYRFAFFDLNFNFISAYDDNFVGNKTIVVPNNSKYMKFTARYRTGDDITTINNCQIELGSTATAYEPYKGSTAVLSTGLPLCSVGDVKDTADYGKGIVTKRTKIENGEVVALDTPTELSMTASEIAAYHNLRTFENTTNITCTDSPQMVVDYLIDTENGASVGQVTANFAGLMYSLMPYPNAGAHNSIYRGKYLGDHVTSAQWAAIKAGTFDDMYIGDYWIIGGRVWRIAAFDYYFNTGDTACTSHHVVIVPDAYLYTYKMNNAGTTAGGYVGSKMYTEGLVQALSIVETAFGAAHILERREFLTNAVTNGVPSGASIYSIKIWLMTEMNVYGCKIFSTVSNGNSRPANYVVDKTQYPLFMYDPQIIGANRVECWLRDIVTNETFACISDYGYAGYSSAANDLAVRPAFAIYQAE